MTRRVWTRWNWVECGTGGEGRLNDAASVDPVDKVECGTGGEGRTKERVRTRTDRCPGRLHARPHLLSKVCLLREGCCIRHYYYYYYYYYYYTGALYASSGHGAESSVVNTATRAEPPRVRLPITAGSAATSPGACGCAVHFQPDAGKAST